MSIIANIILNLMMALLWTGGIFFLWLYLYQFIRKDEVDKTMDQIHKIDDSTRTLGEMGVGLDELEKHKERKLSNNEIIKREEKIWLSKTKQVMIVVYIIVFVILMYTGFHNPGGGYSEIKTSPVTMVSH